jgi:hypothetical protein
MRVKELKESIKTELFDVHFTDSGLTLNLNTRKIHAISDVKVRIWDFNREDAEAYEKYTKELDKETEIEIAEITDSFVTILQATLLEYKTKKDKKLKELKDDIKRKR